jgi:hypothetical protein
MSNSPYASIIAGMISIAFVFLIHLFIKTKIKSGLLGIMLGAGVWQICMGLELIYAYSDRLLIAKIFSWLGGMSIMPLPGFLLIFVTRFSNLGKSWQRFSNIILILSIAAGFLSPWGIEEYAFRNGQYITTPGSINTFHLYWAGFWTFFSYALLVFNRLYGENMTIVNAHQIDIFFTGLGLSFAGVILFTFFIHDTELATFVPILTPLSAFIAVRFFRKIYIEKPMPDMPENIVFTGPFKKIKKHAFHDLGMNIDVYPLEKFSDEQKEIILKQNYWFPEDGLVVKLINQAMAVTVIDRELVVVIRSKYDGIVRPKDIKNLKQLGAQG